MALLPRPYNIAADITHMERVRPLAQAIGLSLQKAAGAEDDPASRDPLKINIGKRLSLSTKAPKLKPFKSKFSALNFSGR